MILCSSRPRHAGRERGVVLFVALIVLVALSLAGIATLRSVEGSTVVAGNLTMKNSTLQSSDRGIQAAYDWLIANRTALSTSNTSVGYYSSNQVIADWNCEATTTGCIWANKGVLTKDAAENTVWYVVHRMCTLPNVAYNATGQSCGLDTSTGGSTTTIGQGSSFSVGAPAYADDPRVFYRVTTRTDGPKNARTITQSMLAIAL